MSRGTQQGEGGPGSQASEVQGSRFPSTLETWLPSYSSPQLQTSLPGGLGGGRGAVHIKSAPLPPSREGWRRLPVRLLVALLSAFTRSRLNFHTSAGSRSAPCDSF